MDLFKMLRRLNRQGNRWAGRATRRLGRWGYQPITDRRMRRRLGLGGSIRLYFLRSGLLCLLALAAFGLFILLVWALS